MIKLVHFADLHLGVENYGRMDPTTGLSSRLTDFLRAFDRVVDYALDEANSVDLVVFAGDAFKTRDPRPTYQRAFARRVRRLSEGGLPVVLVAGNHDLPNAANRAHAVEIFDTLDVPHVYVSSKPAWFRLETQSGPVQVVTLPWVTRSALLARDEYKNRSLEEINYATSFPHIPHRGCRGLFRLWLQHDGWHQIGFHRCRCRSQRRCGQERSG